MTRHRTTHTPHFENRPKRPFFGSGPCAKPEKWSITNCDNALLGRSHRSPEGLGQIQNLLSSLRDLLGIPNDYALIFTPGSATGACETAMWNMLGPCPVDVLCWDVFSRLWHHDIRNQLRCDGNDMHVHGREPCLDHVTWWLKQRNPHNDFMFTWTGTTSGFSIPEQYVDLFTRRSNGLIMCDATAAVMTTSIPWGLMDVISFSWQKALGGEANMGILVCSPKALHRIQSWTPSWPVPRLLRLKKDGTLLHGITQGYTINTPSMLLVQENRMIVEYWQQKGGANAALEQTKTNANTVHQWCNASSWAQIMPLDPSWRALTPAMISVKCPDFHKKPPQHQWRFFKKISDLMAHHRLAFDVLNHPNDYPALRLWCGPTINTDDLNALLLCLDQAFDTV